MSRVGPAFSLLLLCMKVVTKKPSSIFTSFKKTLLFFFLLLQFCLKLGCSLLLHGYFCQLFSWRCPCLLIETSVQHCTLLGVWSRTNMNKKRLCCFICSSFLFNYYYFLNLPVLFFFELFNPHSVSLGSPHFRLLSWNYRSSLQVSTRKYIYTYLWNCK